MLSGILFPNAHRSVWWDQHLCSVIPFPMYRLKNITFLCNVHNTASCKYILYHCVISCCNVGVLLAALCNLFPFPVCWPGQVWWLAGASRARWASCWPGALQRLTRLTRYQMAVEHQQAGKYTNTHTHTREHTVTHASGLSRTYFIYACTHAHTLLRAIKRRALGNIAALQWVWREMLNVFLLYFSPSGWGKSHAQHSDIQLAPSQSSHKCHS